jgi:hypothetical protein
MMPTWISQSYTEETVEYHRAFDYPGRPGCGYWFPCDKDGNINVAELNPAGQENYQRAMAMVDASTIEDKGVEENRHSYRVPGTIRCDRCNKGVEIADSWLNTCEHCGADYDGSGNMLAPRSHWGEETGETLADILGPGEPDY